MVTANVLALEFSVQKAFGSYGNGIGVSVPASCVGIVCVAGGATVVPSEHVMPVTSVNDEAG